MIKIIFKIETKNHIYELKRLNNTFAFVIYDKVFFIAKTYYLQFSKKDMWLLPKKKFVCNNTIKLYGWLFIYIGYSVSK